MKKAEPFLIGGKEETSGKTFTVRNPFSGESVADCFMPSADHLEKALEAAVQAFKITQRMPLYRRAEILGAAANLIKEEKDDIAKTIALESGKPIKYARSEVDRAFYTISISAEEAKRIPGEALDLSCVPAGGGRLGIVKRFPTGPVLGITPFNFPINLVCHKLGPAIASGNSIIIKPSRTTPLTALKLCRIFQRAGCEPGSVNVLPVGAESAEMMIKDQRIKIVTFTGSPEAGWSIKKMAYKKKVLLELGGNAGVVVEPDSGFDYAVKRIIMGAFSFSGQVCISVQRVFIHEKIFDEFTERLIKGAEALVIGDPLDDKTDIGPMITEDAAKHVEEWVNDTEKRGAKILTGGSRDKNVYTPTILTHVPKDSPVLQKEIFGPVIAVEPYKEFEQAVRMVDNSVYGLQAGVFTNDTGKAFYAFNNLNVGGVIINDVPTYRVDPMPYGGVKESGFGREGVKYAIEEMTEPRLLVINNKNIGSSGF